MTEQTDAAEVEALRADLANAECACGHQAEWHSALLGCNAEDWDQSACDCRGDWLDAVLPIIAAREAAARAEALREAADEWPCEVNAEVLRREAATPLRETPEPYTPADWLRDRAARIARTDGAGS